jgi:hypothetical protein
VLEHGSQVQHGRSHNDINLVEELRLSFNSLVDSGDQLIQGRLQWQGAGQGRLVD